MAYETKEVTEKKQWETFVASHAVANFLHSWYWGEFQSALGNVIRRIGIFDKDTLVGVALLIVEDARRGRYAVVPAGPLLNWSDDSLVQCAFDAIESAAKALHCVFVRVRPQILATEESKQIFKAAHFKPAPMHLHAELTWQLDLARSEEELLAGMRKKTRYEVRQAQKQHITVTTTTDPEAIERFYEIQLQTAQRQGFVPFTKKFLKTQFEIFQKNKLVLLYEAYDGTELLAQAFVIFYGNEAAYHYGTGTEAGRSKPGAYAIQWAAIREAKKRGMKRYNFWGVTKPDQTKHRFYGVSIFKRGFGGEEVEYLHAQDYVIKPVRYTAVNIFENIRKRIRRV